MIDYCGLHVHSDYSLRDGFCSVKKLVSHCVKNDYSACCVTDHGTMGGAITLYSECNNVGIKPIVGCEFYVMDDRGKIKTSKREHIILLAKNLEGFKNLIRINNDAVLNGFYKRPVTDYDFIYNHSSGVICLTACVAGKASQLAVKNDFNGLCQFLAKLKGVFGEDVYTELMLIDYVHNDKESKIKITQQEINKRLVVASCRVGVKTIITNDSHYINKGDSEVHDMVLMLSNNKTLKDKAKGNVWTFDVKDLYYKDIQDIYKDYDERFVDSFGVDVLEDSLDSIEEVISKVENYKIDDSFKCPKVSKNDDEALEVVSSLCLERLEQLNLQNNEVYIKRLEKELILLYEKGFLDYFIVVKDIIDYVKTIDKLGVGPGRGSCSGSLVAYLLGIVSVDCIKWDLPFERFLNYERSDPPDIDSDISPEYRELVKEYILKKYPGKCCSIGTYGKLKFKSTLLDVCRVFDIPVNQVFAVTKKLPMDIDDFTLSEAIEKFKFLGGFLEKYRHFDIARYFNSLYGSIRNVSKHAAGVIICDQVIDDQIPLIKSGEHFVSAWSDGGNKELSKLGFLKMDVLGLSAVKILSDSVNLIKKTKNEIVSLNDIDLTCSKTFKAINKINLCGIFQFDTPISIQQVKKIKPTSIMELSNITALIRPGPLRMGMDKIYIKNKLNGYVSICEEVDFVLKDTYGVILYQEQIMSIVQSLGGFTLGQADSVRRLLIKVSKGSVKNAESNSEVIAIKKRFIAAASKKVGDSVSKEIWSQMLSFCGYGFSLNHSVPYSIIGYWESWLKAHYPLEFYCSLLNNVDTFQSGKDGSSKINKIVREMRRSGIEIYLPDVNISDEGFSVYNGGIMFGLGNIKGIVKAANDLITNRPYNNLGDIQDKNKKRIVNKRVVEALLGSGALKNIYPDSVKHMDEVKYLGMAVCVKKENDAKNPSLLSFKGKGGNFSGLLVSVEEFKTKKNNDLMAKLTFNEIDDSVMVWPSDYIDLKPTLKKKVGNFWDFRIKVFNDSLFISG